MQNFNDKIALVTGSSEGIGLSTAYSLAKQGATIIINGRNSDKLHQAEYSIRQIQDVKYLILQGDITNAKDRDAIVKEAINKFNKIDILINNVGGGTDKHRIEDITEDEWNQTIDFNLNTSYAMCRNVLPGMRANQYGRIINVSSVAGRFRGRLSGPHYSAAKAGLHGLTRHLAWDAAKDGITVNAVAPGFVSTERALLKWNNHTDEDKAQMLTQIPMHRFAKPEEIASAIVFLASEEASYITGVTLDVNGGFFMS